MARLHPDGTLDKDWEVSVNGTVLDLHVSDDCAYIAGEFEAVGGDFNIVAGQRHGRIVVLDADTLQPVWSGSELSSLTETDEAPAPGIPQWETNTELEAAAGSH